MSRYKLFIGHLCPDARERDVQRLFKDHGFNKSIVEVVVKTGYGFVIFEDQKDADDAVYELNGKELLGSRLQVEFARQQGGPGDDRRDRRDHSPRGDRGGYGKYSRPYNTNYRVLIENLSTRCSWQDIKDYFRQAGEVTFAKCHREKMGEGIVEFASKHDMKHAVRHLNDTELFGKRLKLTVLSGGDGGCSRSRSRSPRRSRSPAGRGGGDRGRSRSRSPPARSRSRSPRRSRSRSRSPCSPR